MKYTKIASERKLKLMIEFSIKEILGLIAVILAILAFIPYTISIFKRQTTPHIFSYIIWGVTMSIAFVAQIINDGGAGSWTIGVGAIYCSAIAILAIKYGEKNITKKDWLFLFMALLIIPIWITTENDLLAIILASLLDVIGFLPTFRKTYIKPYSENLTAYILAGTSYFISLFALAEFSYTTSIYPLTLLIISALFVGMSLWRRRFIPKPVTR